MANYEVSPQPHAAFDLGGWHGACPGVQLVFSTGSGVPWLFCPVCRCAAQLDVVAPHITPESSKRARAEEAVE